MQAWFFSDDINYDMIVLLMTYCKYRPAGIRLATYNFDIQPYSLEMKIKKTSIQIGCKGYKLSYQSISRYKYIDLHLYYSQWCPDAVRNTPGHPFLLNKPSTQP